MTSEALPAADAPVPQTPGQPDNPGEPPTAGTHRVRAASLPDPEPTRDPRDGHRRLNLTDPKAIRALAHPVRWALLEALGQAGTLTATQASEMLGESPANCAFHLRTLAKYGFVEEAGGGRGRERPWRQSYDGLSLSTGPDDPPAVQAASQALNQVWVDRTLTRAQRSLTSSAAWPKALVESLGAMVTREYVTAEEARELHTEIQQAFDRLFGPDGRFTERRNPKLRPADAIPVEFVLLAYPVLDLPPLPKADEADADEDESLGVYARESRAEPDRDVATPEGPDSPD
jgi:predicted transcriptional regulator